MSPGANEGRRHLEGITALPDVVPTLYLTDTDGVEHGFGPTPGTLEFFIPAGAWTAGRWDPPGVHGARITGPGPFTWATPALPSAPLGEPTACPSTTGGGRYRCCLNAGHEGRHHVAGGLYTSWANEPAGAPTPPTPSPEHCMLCGKIWGDHFDGPFCDRVHGHEEDEPRQFVFPLPSAPPTPSGIGPTFAQLITSLLYAQAEYSQQGSARLAARDAAIIALTAKYEEAGTVRVTASPSGITAALDAMEKLRNDWQNAIVVPADFLAYRAAARAAVEAYVARLERELDSAKRRIVADNDERIRLVALGSRLEGERDAALSNCIERMAECAILKQQRDGARDTVATLEARVAALTERVKLLDRVIVEHHASSVLREEHHNCPVCMEHGGVAFFVETSNLLRAALGSSGGASHGN